MHDNTFPHFSSISHGSLSSVRCKVDHFLKNAHFTQKVKSLIFCARGYLPRLSRYRCLWNRLATQTMKEKRGKDRNYREAKYLIIAFHVYTCLFSLLLLICASRSSRINHSGDRLELRGAFFAIHKLPCVTSNEWKSCSLVPCPLIAVVSTHFALFLSTFPLSALPSYSPLKERFFPF